jgi:beta-glucuronidase
MSKDALDPFHHLHDEDYLDSYDTPRIGADSLITLADRPRTSLCGPCHFTRDLFDEGLRQKWYQLEAVPATDWTHPRLRWVARG